MLLFSTLVVFLVLHSNKSTWWQPRDLVNEMTATETGQFRLPPKLDVNSGNVSENFKRRKRQVEVYLAAFSAASEKDDKVQTDIILNCAGPHVLEVYDTFIWTDDGVKDKPDKVLEGLERYCNPREHEVIEYHRFWDIPYQEPFDKFLTELKTREAACNFLEKDRMLRDKIVFTVTGKLQELLFREDNLTLDKAIKIFRAFEQSKRQVKEFRESITLSSSSTIVNRITQNSETKTPGGKKGSQMNKASHKGREKLKFNCKFCGYKHEKQRDKCPSWGKTCDNYKGLNHFKSKCKNIHALNQSNDNEEHSDDQWLMSISNRTDSVTATLT